MPRVPTYDYPEVLPELARDTRQYATGQAFGAGIGAQVEGIGKEVSQLGNILGQHTVRMQTLVNQAEVDEQATNWMIAQGELDSAHKALEGKARADAFPKYVQDSKALREKFAGNLTNPHARRLFDHETKRYFGYSIRNEAAGVGTALKQYQTQANSKLIVAGNEVMLGDPLSDQVFSAGLDTALRGVRQEGVNKGWTPEETGEREKEVETKFWSDRIKAIAYADPEKAAEMFEKNKEKILPSKRIEIENSITGGRQQQAAKNSFAVYGTQELVKSDIKSMLTTGQGVPQITEKTVRAVLGEKAVEVWKLDRDDAQKVWANTHNLPTMTQEQMQQKVNALVPKPGSANFQREQKVYTAVKEAMDNQVSLRLQDPAMSVDDDPAVKNIKRQYGEDNSFGRNLLIDARLAAQTRAGIPEIMQSPITVKEANEMMAPLTRMLPGQESQVFTQIIKSFQTAYGDQADEAFSFALKQQRMSGEMATIATSMMKRILNNTTPTPTSAAAAANTIEVTTSNETVQVLDPSGAMVSVPKPIEAPKPVTKPSRAKQILDVFPPFSQGSP